MLGRKHLLEQKVRRAVEEGGELSLPAFGSFQTAWTGSPALGETPLETKHKGGDVHFRAVQAAESKTKNQLTFSNQTLILGNSINREIVVLIYLHDAVESRLKASQMLLLHLNALLNFLLHR